MQFSASLNGTTATITTNNCGSSTALTITDASNLAADLAAFTGIDGGRVDATTFTTSGTIPRTEGVTLNGDLKSAGIFLGDGYSPGFSSGGQRNRDFQVHSRGYLLTAKEDGVEIMTPGTTSAVQGTMTIPRDQISNVITQLNA